MIPGGVNELLLRSAAAGGATAGRSVRFNAPDSAYLSRTPASAGNRKTWTWSGWVKRCGTGNMSLVDAGTSTAFRIRFSSEQLDVASNTTIYRRTAAVLRDFSAWYHIVIVLDTTQATASNRVKVYINGQEITTFGTSNDPTLNEEFELNSNVAHTIGTLTSAAGNFFNGYLALVHFIDGQALTPSSFGETSATTGQWIAKTYSGSYGTNGFFLDFTDNSTAAALGYDAAGSNDWTVNNLSVTAGSGNDSLRDHPTSAGTSTGAGGEVSGNYCTWNPLHGLGQTLTNGNLDASINNASGAWVAGTIGVSSGKWYWEIPSGSGDRTLGVVQLPYTLTQRPYFNTAGYVYSNGGNKINNSSTGVTYGASYGNSDVIGIALDMDAGTLTFYKNNVSQGTAFTGLTGTFAPVLTDQSSGSTITAIANFGQRPWAYACPSGFSPLVDTLLPQPTITKPNTVFDARAYSGNGSTQTLSGFQFSPDFVWLKSRASVNYHELYDTIRGATNVLYSNVTAAEETANGVTGFTSDGFNLGNYAPTNGSGGSYIAWTWDAGSSNATNTSGTITSTCRTNISAGFSIVSYTGTGANASVGHSLGVAPSFMVVKNRDFADVWLVYHSSLGATKYIILNRTDAAGTISTAWNDTAPTSSVFSIGSLADVNRSSNKFIAYCWAPVAGYSAFGSYTGSTSKPFVYLGFRPKVVWIKGITSNAYTSYMSWYISDSARDTDNPQNGTGILWANRSDAEGKRGDGDTGGSFLDVDFLSNGFRILDTTSVAELNFTGATYIYCAWAEAPFPYARAR